MGKQPEIYRPAEAATPQAKVEALGEIARVLTWNGSEVQRTRTSDKMRHGPGNLMLVEYMYLRQISQQSQ